ncbi:MULTISPECIES: FmdB family zinc ribbon protein [Desulfococcus]|jgi:putative FmdB family regulatory protein|uniref:Regulatory protein, FmdB family n=1 Tax=Desulfococcus multivorans DSM 2059 TaxID=1121405 RepID=S7VA73_DESML|nr:FmdB family zinc ribbon protein [Desulfococcus multivorans]AOY58053.1 regulatory protein, FmdB family [Desulfococcus multivorans]AQV00415.1 FmdB family transcriptional regulator [Desulfococcus multivorans]EPR41378.1 regulatory protein, FmdB family [Desulfococcus multivorans DSM 2059]SJZ71285.1 putative regulatory protein, FmdB family [Desulfococcus multivorans DSM 2059]
MPIYEYKCEQCGKTEEVLQKISEAPLTTCEHCSGKLHKLISHSAFHLKGSGWYVTDYARKTPSSGKADTPTSSTHDTKASASDGSNAASSKTSS